MNEKPKKKREYSHLLGIYMIGEGEKALKHAKEQYEILQRTIKSFPNEDGQVAHVEIRVFLVDTEKELS